MFEIRDEFPQEVETREHVWIPMADGTRLAARVWLPRGAEGNPVPALFEYIPYRKRDGTRWRDDIHHAYFAGHGYACVRVDIRGSGDSEGVLTDEYLQSELDDGVAIIRWIAEQPWCTGSVGMIGISWGGFNGLQIAALRPPDLKAIVTVASTDDRYEDDVHYMGGCLLGDNLSWASTMFAYNSLPPDPATVGDAWRDMWRQRLEGSGLWLESWLRHQRRDGYWRHGSINEDFGAIQCPVYAVSGWADGYSNAVFRLLESLDVPRRGLVGPWSHKYPHLGVPGPAIGFLQDCLRWWDHWLKGEDTGIMDEPMLRVWMQDSVPPTTRYQERPGRWVAETAWPSPHTVAHEYTLTGDYLVEDDTGIPALPLTVQSPLSLGLFAGKWCSYSAGPDLAHDQRQEDGGALVFETAPLQAPLEILGFPEVELELASSRPVAMIAARLSDVAPDGKATRVTYGLLNLTHRDGHADPEPLEPGKRYRVRLRLNGIAQQFPQGHRLRLSLSSSYWPLAWAPPQSVQLTVWSGNSRLILPGRAPCPGDASLPAFGPAEGARPTPVEQREPGHHNWWVKRDLANDESTLEVIRDDGVKYLAEIDLETTLRAFEYYRSTEDDFGSLEGETHWVRELRRGDWHIRTITRTVLSADTTHFHLRAELDAFEGDQRVYSQNWNIAIPRDLV
jgi:putative CocE/NonD family hydrolase